MAFFTQSSLVNSKHSFHGSSLTKKYATWIFTCKKGHVLGRELGCSAASITIMKTGTFMPHMFIVAEKWAFMIYFLKWETAICMLNAMLTLNSKIQKTESCVLGESSLNLIVSCGWFMHAGISQCLLTDRYIYGLPPMESTAFEVL